MLIHATAVVSPEAIVDPTAEVGAYAVIDGPARIGARVVLGPHAAVLGHTVLGPGCRVHAGAVVGDLPQDRAFAGGVTYCRLGAETIVREHVTIHRGTAEGSSTELGEGCLVLAGAHVAHNCRLGDGVQIINGALLGGYVEVGSRAIISGNAAVHQFVRIGELALVGGLAKVTQDVPPFLMFDGPGRCVGVNVVGMRRAGCTAEEREEIKAAYKRLYRTGGSWGAAIEAVEAAAATAAGRSLAAFLRTPSRRGISARAWGRDSKPPVVGEGDQKADTQE